MAGVMINAPVLGGYLAFSIHQPGTLAELKMMARSSPYLQIQVEGDDLEAVLWGLENWKDREVPVRKNENFAGDRISLVTKENGRVNFSVDAANIESLADSLDNWRNFIERTELPPSQHIQYALDENEVQCPNCFSWNTDIASSDLIDHSHICHDCGQPWRPDA